MFKQLTLSCFLLLAFSLSVASNTFIHFDGKYVKTEYCKVDVSKTTDVVFNFSPTNMNYFAVSFDRDYTLISYKVGKVQNKSLPLCKNIWLLNKQIALK